MLGVDWELANGAYRIKQIVRGGPWDTDVRSPLAEPGVDVKEGDYVLAVNGVPLDARRDPWAAFQGLGRQDGHAHGQRQRRRPTGARQVVVKCLGDETELRFRAWIEQRRKRVDEATGGKVGYVYVQSTGVDAQNELVRQFMAQWTQGRAGHRRALQQRRTDSRPLHRAAQPAASQLLGGARRREPAVAAGGARAGRRSMLINGWSGSGGDAFPFYFREAGLGPLIGTRTWGGLIGISGAPSLVDGGDVTVPTFRMYDVRGQWFAEGHGVEPDIVVEEDPTSLAKGVDPQLERAIDELKKRLAAQPATPGRPGAEKRVPGRND